MMLKMILIGQLKVDETRQKAGLKTRGSTGQYIDINTSQTYLGRGFNLRLKGRNK